MESKVILHCDANNFYASVEMLLDPSLKDKRIAVAGDPEARRGVVLAKNYAAKACGVVTAEPIWQALKKCPDLVLVRPHHAVYERVSEKLFSLYVDYTDRVEAFSVDECWLDVTHSLKLFGSGEKIADEIRRRAREEIGITLSVGVSFTKIFAKLGSDMKKPDATTVINEYNYKTKVWPLPVDALMMVGGSTKAVLNKLNIRTIGDLAAYDREKLAFHLGVNGFKLSDNARGIERDEVRLYYEEPMPESVGHSTTLPYDLTDESEAGAVIDSLAELVATRLRKHKLKAHGVSMTVKFNNFETLSRQHSLPVPVNTAKELSLWARKLLADNYKFGKDMPIRLLGVSAFSLTSEDDAPYQMNMFDDRDPRGESLEKTLDSVRAKYGYGAIKKANIMKHDDLCKHNKEPE